jgi:hypothetical protein
MVLPSHEDVTDAYRQAIQVASGLDGEDRALLGWDGELPSWAATLGKRLRAAHLAATDTTDARRAAHQMAQAAERNACALLREIIPNPCRPVPVLDPAWLRWNDGTVPRLAQQMYDSRDFVAMPILADALEEAGCTSADILDHCRGPGPHVRGCWVVDLILSKDR